MSIYIDNMRASFGRMIMCHMIADTHDELIEMADKLTLNRKWLQQSNNHGEHFDISLGYKKRAIQFGAIEISMRELAQKTYDRRGGIGHNKYFGVKDDLDQ